MNKRRWFKNQNNIDASSILFKILKILIICLEIFSALLLTFYVVGNYQNFEDKSQKIILTTLSYSSILTCLLTIPFLVESIFMLFNHQTVKRAIKSIVYMIFTIIFCILLISVSSVLTFLSAGF